MPRVRIEWMPVQLFGLGHLGFDHMQLVLEQGEGTSPQDDWFVMEGVRDPTDLGTYLVIEGSDGRTSLATANLASRAALADKIGTPDLRGSRVLAYNGDEMRAWETMASYARDIDGQDYPYIALGLPGSPTPTINSSSAVASLLHYSGLDPTQNLPYGMRLSPGTSTMLGTGGDDEMRVAHGFTTLLGGDGNDHFIGGGDRQTEKYFGGSGDDVFRWSPGFNIVHGGQPQLGYATDGTDVIDYSGAGEVTITFNRHWIPHKSPNFIAVHDSGIDHLFSIERIQWNAKSDQIRLGKEIDLLEDEHVHQSSDSEAQSNRRTARLLADDHAVVGDAFGGSDGDDRLIGTALGETIDAQGGDDTLYGGGGNDSLFGGAGSDGYVYLPGDGDDVIIDLTGDAGFDELLLTGGIGVADLAVFRVDGRDLLLSLPGGSVLVSGFFTGDSAGIERVVFDHDAPLSRSALEMLAVDLVEAPGETVALLMGGHHDHAAGASVGGPGGWHDAAALPSLF